MTAVRDHGGERDLTLLDWIDDPVLGSNILVRDLLVAGVIMILGIVLASFMPRLMSRSIAKMFANLEEKTLLKKFSRGSAGHIEEKGRIRRRMKVTVATPVRRGLIGFYLISFLVLAVYSLPIEMGTLFRLFGRDYEAWRFLQFGVAITLILLLSLFALEPILRASIYALLGNRVSKRNKYRLYRSLRVSVKILLIIFGTFASLYLSFTRAQLQPVGWLIEISVFSMILITTFIIAQLLVSLTEPQFRTGDVANKDTGKAIGRVIKISLYLLGLVIALLYVGISPTTVFGSTVAAGIVLGFGLQDTIANLAAGVLIVMDKPFVIGDRIRIDWSGRETWGDVIDISLRSTWIKTPEDEMIVVPNNVIASSQVWNYTRESPRMALQLDIGISYDSDWKLAEKLILGVLHKHPLVLNRPPSNVLMKEFGESSLILTVWLWISEARDKEIIQSDVLKRIKDAFDRNGVEIPYPYLTLVNKKEIPKPKRLSEEYRSPIYLPSMGWKKFKIEHDSMVEVETTGSVVLAPTSGSYPARYTAPVVMETARKMGASVTALYIKTTGGSEIDGQRALRIYNEVAKVHGVEIRLLFKEGDVLENILDAADSEGAAIVVLGSTEESVFGRLSRRSLTRELLLHLSIPTMVVPITKTHKKRREAGEFGEGQVDFTSLQSLERIEEKDSDLEED